METTKGYWLRYYGNKASIVWSDVETVGKTFHVERSMDKARSKAYSGYLSKAAQSLIHKRLYAWMEAIRVGNHTYKHFKSKDQRRLTFVTLTLSATQRHDDKWIKKNMLELFMKRLQYNYKVVNYFWKAEVQKNGNLHFHLVLDTYIPFISIQSNWNEIQRACGYLDNYFAMNGHYAAPSTHVRQLSAMNDGIGYAMKYCSKNDSCRPIEGAIYRFSNSLLDITIPPILLTHDDYVEWGLWCAKYVKKITKDDFWTALFFDTRKIGFKQPAFVAVATRDYYLSAYNILYVPCSLDFSMHDLNDYTFRQINHSQAPAQSFSDTSKANVHAHRKAELQVGAHTSPAPSVSQLSLFEASFHVPWFYDV